MLEAPPVSAFPDYRYKEHTRLFIWVLGIELEFSGLQRSIFYQQNHFFHSFSTLSGYGHYSESLLDPLNIFT